MKANDKKPEDQETRRLAEDQNITKTKVLDIKRRRNPKIRKPKDHVKIISNISKTPEDERISCLIFSSCSVCET